jgi:PadR family transcriptional regulator, regulatory protein AphA
MTYVTIYIYTFTYYAVCMIKYILLGFLNYQPMTGYELKQTLDHSVSHFWHAYHSQIYTTLRQMEADGLVVSEFLYSEGQPDRRVYSLTDAGRADFTAWLNQSLTEMSPIKEELLVRLFFSARRDPKSVLAELYLQRELHQKKLAEYRGLASGWVDKNVPALPELKADSAFWRMTLEMGIAYEVMYAQWLAQTIQEIEGL